MSARPKNTVKKQKARIYDSGIHGTNARFDKNQNHDEIKSCHYIIS